MHATAKTAWSRAASGMLASEASVGVELSAPVAVVGILVVAMIALYASSIQVRRMEINYTTE